MRRNRCRTPPLCIARKFMYYFDTNSIRRRSSLDDSCLANIIISQLSIYEIISGITSEDEFYKRKQVLKRIELNFKNIIWESPKSLIIKAFNLKGVDEDVEVTKIMMTAILHCESFKSLKDIRVIVLGYEYTIEHFIWYDNIFTNYVLAKTKNAISNTDKIQRLALKEIKEIPSFVRVNHEIEIRNMLFSYLGCDSTIDKEYVDAVKYYFNNPLLDDFFNTNNWGGYNAVAYGQNPGKNDAFDYAHMAYSSYAKYIVTDDKFFHRIPKDILNIEVISYDDYCNKSKKS